MKLAYNETFFLKISFIYFFSEGKGGRKRGRETSMCKRNIGRLSHSPNWGPGPKPRHVSGNRTSDPLVCRLGLNPLSYSVQGNIMRNS